MNENKYRVVDIDDLKPGNIKHQTLPDWFLIRAQLIYHIIGIGCPMSFHAFVENFQRDADPVMELEIWERIAAAFIALTSGPNKVDEKASDIVATLLNISMLPFEHLDSVDNKLRPYAEAYINASYPGKSAIKLIAT